MGKVIDITNQRFNKLLVIKRDFEKNINHKAYWICKCDCGNIVSVRGQDLRQGKTKSCGCLLREKTTQRNLIDLTNQRFGHLIAKKRIGISKSHRGIWLCQCDCGNSCEVETTSLTSGNTKSCGCLNSYAEERIALILKEHNIIFKQQYTFPDLLGDKGTRLRFDFAIFDKNNQLKQLIEFQGEQHFIPFKNDTLETFEKRKKYDLLKREYCKQNSIPLVEINYKDRQNLTWEFIYQNINNWGE